MAVVVVVVDDDLEELEKGLKEVVCLDNLVKPQGMADGRLPLQKLP